VCSCSRETATTNQSLANRGFDAYNRSFHFLPGLANCGVRFYVSRFYFVQTGQKNVTQQELATDVISTIMIVLMNGSSDD
jgi:hypothetical protein